MMDQILRTLLIEYKQTLLQYFFSISYLLQSRHSTIHKSMTHRIVGEAG